MQNWKSSVVISTSLKRFMRIVLMYLYLNYYASSAEMMKNQRILLLETANAFFDRGSLSLVYQRIIFKIKS